MHFVAMAVCLFITLHALAKDSSLPRPGAVGKTSGAIGASTSMVRGTPTDEGRFAQLGKPALVRWGLQNAASRFTVWVNADGLIAYLKPGDVMRFYGKGRQPPAMPLIERLMLEPGLSVAGVPPYLDAWSAPDCQVTKNFDAYEAWDPHSPPSRRIHLQVDCGSGHWKSPSPAAQELRAILDDAMAEVAAGTTGP